MFNPAAAKTELLAKLTGLEPFILPAHGCDGQALEGRAHYIQTLAQLVANHIEEMAADADASISTGRVNEEDARAIADVGADLAGRIEAAAARVPEAA